MSQTTARVALNHITKRFARVTANDDVSLSIQAGEIHALLGENGAGKSTLVQIMYGLYQPDEGEIVVDGRPVRLRDPSDAIACGIGMVHQEFMLVQPMSVVENVILGLKESASGRLNLHAAARRLRVLSERHGLDVDPWAKIQHLPIGVQQRVEILKLLYRDAQVLILDEPTAVLTPQEKEGLFATLRSLRAEGRSVVIVTHKLYEIMAIADRVSVMRAGKMVDTVAVSDTSETDLARRMVGRDVVLRIAKPPRKAGETVLHVDNIALRDESGKQKIWRASLKVAAGEILGIAGVDGNGQSELADALLNLRTIEAGRIWLDGEDITEFSPAERREKGIGFIPADRRGVGSVTSLSITDNAILGAQRTFTRARGWLLDRDGMARHARRIIDHFQVRTPDIAFEAGKLSGGNLQKLILGREVARRPRLLVVEQPTRGLDVGAVEAVWQGLLAAREQGCAIVMISAELEEIMNLSDRIAVMYGGQIAGVLEHSEATAENIGELMAGGKTAKGGLHETVA
ncbi:Putative deoxyribose-specific ABC transporter ATP-binding protein [Paramixta manurensis]|uniref:Deoxyribose-specific ABC transporter ATP-binding protein n=1 Tax=Paramixta manurensis TaxID=2740817 RepID=A0A6M8U6X7_9GAMM|nr:Putative deoxyribose-specific ABC transporter ATP-binding protein [Erwiniaceae bacterium PD-1]